jgi:hypothetical protein
MRVTTNFLSANSKPDNLRAKMTDSGASNRIEHSSVPSALSLMSKNKVSKCMSENDRHEVAAAYEKEKSILVRVPTKPNNWDRMSPWT